MLTVSNVNHLVQLYMTQILWQSINGNQKKKVRKDTRKGSYHLTHLTLSSKHSSSWLARFKLANI